MKNLTLTPLAIAVSVVVAGLGQPVFAANKKEKVVEEVITVGTRSAKPRSATDSPVAVDVISGDQFTSVGNVADITDNLKTQIPSYTATPATGDGSAFIRPTSLRGMAPDQSLVLVNGKRRHRSALVQFFAPAAGNGAHGVDIGMIPSISLKSIEVLRDGAAAQYGSDAIAGVMNFVLKDADEGGKVLLQYGEFFDGEASLMAGANGGFKLGENGFINLSIETNDNDALSRGTQRPNAQALIDAGVSGVGADAPFGDEPFVQTWGRPETSGTRLAFNTGVDINDEMRLYAHGNYAETEGRYRFFYRYPGVPGPIDADGNDILGFGIRGDIFGAVPAARNALPAGFTPYLDGDQEDFSIVVGLKGELNDDTIYDVSISSGTSELDYFLWNTVAPQLIDPVTGDPGQRNFNMGGYEQEEINVNVDLSTSLSDELNIAYGLEWREESFTTIAGEPAAYNNSPSGMSSVTPADAGTFDRDNYAVYVDVEHDVSEEWLMQYALRYEDFSDFGDTVNGKIASRFSVNEQFTLRGAISTGFHAPTPGQANISSIITTSTGGILREEGLVPPTNPTALLFGGKELTEEQTVNFSLGFSYDIGDATLTVDGYMIEVEDRIYRTGDIPIGDGKNIAFYTNALDVDHQGLDVVFTMPHEWNDDVSTDFTVALNHNTIDVVSQREVNGVFPVSDDKVEDIENNYPENRWVATAMTQIGEQWSVMVRANYYGEHYDENGTINSTSSPSAKIDPVVYIDLELGWEATEAIKVSLGGSNIFDEFVDKLTSDTANTLSSGLPYPRRTAANYEGGSWYLRGTYSF